MDFFLKWIEGNGTEPLSSNAFDTRSAAADCACYMLRYFRQKPLDLWIEAADGRRVMTGAEITKYCESLDWSAASPAF